MSEFVEGKIAATFQLGKVTEDKKEAYENEIVSIDGMRVALHELLSRHNALIKQVQHEIATDKIPIKEGELTVRVILKCSELVKQQMLECEGKKLAANGAIDVLKQVISDIKKAWEHDKNKLTEIQEFEAHKPVDMKERPVGYMPEEVPLEKPKKKSNRTSKKDTNS